ncbi:response regulator transcription factor [Conexibacter stalactiti]|uniref:Response regulator transcription factor n=1 Tax=Conexibacter stalactiti TaxID=1940611 RepID=A0ABU4HQ71_9ACTN|nr:response regulator transcription factor [Conexibacter stalactiti]MDW5595450.1 response regulator transcription factor [Conexibacter stalactiti]MEC5036092.1 response regulator transcription factor [Conexibacter stalactiti]
MTSSATTRSTTRSSSNRLTAAGDLLDSRPMTLRVVIADDSSIIRTALEHVLEGSPSLEVVGLCGDRDEVLRAVEELAPDVVVTDVRMPPALTDEGVQVATQLRRTHPRVGVVVLSQYAEPRYGIALLDAGADGRGYLLKERVQSRGQLVAAIETVARGGSVIDSRLVERMIAERRRIACSPLAQLTTRETEILALVARGCSNQAIADELAVSKRAVEKHIHAIFLKFGIAHEQDVSQRVKAALIYLAEQPS